MTVWLFALTLTAIACATLFYAGAGRRVNAGRGFAEATRDHFRARLAAIDSDAAVGRMGSAEAVAAKSELAREVMRLEGDAAAQPAAAGNRPTVIAVIGLVAVLALGTYATIGRPDLPAAPLAGRDVSSESGIDLESAVKTIETRLTEMPDDLRGWTVIAPVYMQLGRYTDAVHALRRVNELSAPTADTLTDLGEALMMRDGGAIAAEAMGLFRQAAAMDRNHIRSRYYIANEETRAGNYEAAIRDWNELLGLGEGDEPWAVTARNGVNFAEARLAEAAGASSAPVDGAEAIVVPDQAQIDAMVDGLEARLMGEGGSIEEWTRLVRSRMVQGRTADAQVAYDAARKAYPDASVRTELDVLAADNGLVAK
jgi:cytochrome c-type biogenesis protein CcmH